MSFSQMKKEELLAIVDEVGGVVGVDVKSTKTDIIAALEEAGITWQTYSKINDEENSEDVVQNPDATNATDNFVGKTVLLKMERKNPTFEIQGFKFTKNHPYVVMTEKQAQDIIDAAWGFRLASPQEAKDFYS
jgi:hypothetical protein